MWYVTVHKQCKINPKLPMSVPFLTKFGGKSSKYYEQISLMDTYFEYFNYVDGIIKRRKSCECLSRLIFPNKIIDKFSKILEICS